MTNPNGRPPILSSENLRQLVKIALSRPQDLGLPYTARHGRWLNLRTIAGPSVYCRLSATSRYGDCFDAKICPSRGQKPGRILQFHSSRKKTAFLSFITNLRGTVLLFALTSGGLWNSSRFMVCIGLESGTHTAFGQRIEDCLAPSSFWDSMTFIVIVWLERSISVRESLIYCQRSGRLRRAYPTTTRLYVVMDNLPHHKNDDLLNYFSTTHKIVPVWTPTYASWLNIIEPHFGAMKKNMLLTFLTTRITVPDDYASTSTSGYETAKQAAANVP